MLSSYKEEVVYIFHVVYLLRIITLHPSTHLCEFETTNYPYACSIVETYASNIRTILKQMLQHY